MARPDPRKHSTYRHATGLAGVDLLRADFAAEGLQEVLALIGTDRPRPFGNNLLSDPRLAQDFLARHRALAAGPDLLLHQQSLVQCFGALYGYGAAWPSSRAGAAADKALTRALDLMRSSPEQPLTLARLAAEARLPARHFIAGK